METIYSASQKEINRRIGAYTRMIASFYLSAIIISILFFQPWHSNIAFAFLVMAVILFCSRIVVVKYLSSLGHGTVGLSAETIRKNEQIFIINEIRKVSVKKTTLDSIREIHIVFANKSSTYVNNSTAGIDVFYTNLMQFLPAGTQVAVNKEPIDYDHPAFYFFFGILLSIVSILTLKLFLNLNYQALQFMNVGIGIMAGVLGIYFLRTRPIYKHDEKKGQIADSIWGVFFLVAGIAVIVVTALFII